MGSGVLVIVVVGGGVSSGALVTVAVSGSELLDSLEGTLVTVVVDGSAVVSSLPQAVRPKKTDEAEGENWSEESTTTSGDHVVPFVE